MRLLKKYKSFLFSRYTKKYLTGNIFASEDSSCKPECNMHLCLDLSYKKTPPKLPHPHFFHILQHFSLKIISSLILKLLLKNTSKQFLTGIWPGCFGYKRKIFHFFLQYLQSSRTTLSLHPLPCSETFPATPYSLNLCYYPLTSTDQFSLGNKIFIS